MKAPSAQFKFIMQKLNLLNIILVFFPCICAKDLELHDIGDAIVQDMDDEKYTEDEEPVTKYNYFQKMTSKNFRGLRPRTPAATADPRRYPLHGFGRHRSTP